MIINLIIYATNLYFRKTGCFHARVSWALRDNGIGAGTFSASIGQYFNVVIITVRARSRHTLTHTLQVTQAELTRVKMCGSGCCPRLKMIA